MNNWDKIRSMDFDEFAAWLDENVIMDTAPWTLWFDENYCQKCQNIITTYNFGDYEREAECTYCEVNGDCRFFPGKSVSNGNLDVIKLWLECKVNG